MSRSAFHLLKTMGARGAAALAEILAVAARTAEGVITGNYRGAAASFVDYWSGRGAWAALRPSVQAAMTRWMPKAPLDFRALIDEPTRTTAYSGLRFPVLIMRGEHAPAPTRLIAETLPTLMPAARLAVIGRRRPHGSADACGGGQRGDRAAYRRVGSRG